jgi:hypothetical protein
MFDWDRTTKLDGVIPLDERREGRDPRHRESFVEWEARCEKSGTRLEPNGYSGGVGGGGVKTITTAEARLRLHPRSRWLPAEPNTTYYVRVEWPENYRKIASDFISFVDTFLVPLLGEKYAELDAVFRDAEATKHAEARSIRAEAMKLAANLRLTFGFDS